VNKEENRRFVAKSESLVRPRDITAISFLGDFNRYLSKKVQDKIMRMGAAKIPYMGFIVEPYGFFLSYRVRDEAAAQALLPEGYELAPASVFKNGEKHPLVVFSAFSARTSAFMGMRLECYLIARDKATGRMAWIITDYETNTNSHDPRNGFCGYTCSEAVHTVTPYAELMVRVKAAAGGREFLVSADLNTGRMEELDEALWVEGNMTVDYGGSLKDGSSKPFSLIFDPFLMKEARRIPLEGIRLEANTFLNGIIDPGQPLNAAVFPYSQHFIIKQDLGEGQIARQEDLERQVAVFLDRQGIKTMSGDDLKRPFFLGLVISFLVNLGIIAFLLIKLLT
jgi:hypothetical protein